MNDTIIKLDHVSYRRDGKYILRDISWEVKRGEHWVLLGLNGSGKTTTLNMINGYIFPSDGTIEVLGHRFGQTSIVDLRRKIGWVSSAISQYIPINDYPLHIVLSGKFGSLGLWEAVSDEDIAHANKILDQLNMRHLAERQYGKLSQGEKQKVLIGRALMSDPDILIFDEAFNGLDIFASHDLEQTISRLSDTGIAFILVTHNTNEILPVFDKALLLKGGLVHSQGAIADMIEYRNLSDFYGRDVDVFHHNGRFYLSLKD
jgi:iron complex transport system ATP-binding protein